MVAKSGFSGCWCWCGAGAGAALIQAVAGAISATVADDNLAIISADPTTKSDRTFSETAVNAAGPLQQKLLLRQQPL